MQPTVTGAARRLCTLDEDTENQPCTSIISTALPVRAIPPVITEHVQENSEQYRRSAEGSKVYERVP